jgi:DNA-binding NtrC family response regulator
MASPRAVAYGATAMPLAAPHAPEDARPRVIIVDVDRRVQQSLADVLELGGLRVVATAGDVREALEKIEMTGADYLLVDPRLPDIDAGAALLSSVALGWPDLSVILMGWGEGIEQSQLGVHADAYVPKNADTEEFVAATLRACGC